VAFSVANNNTVKTWELKKSGENTVFSGLGTPQQPCPLCSTFLRSGAHRVGHPHFSCPHTGPLSPAIPQKHRSTEVLWVHGAPAPYVLSGLLFPVGFCASPWSHQEESGTTNWTRALGLVQLVGKEGIAARGSLSTGGQQLPWVPTVVASARFSAAFMSSAPEPGGDPQRLKSLPRFP
jgi:hypothetical protein